MAKRKNFGSTKKVHQVRAGGRIQLVRRELVHAQKSLKHHDCEGAHRSLMVAAENYGAFLAERVGSGSRRVSSDTLFRAQIKFERVCLLKHR